jgi:hypothetical protein
MKTETNPGEQYERNSQISKVGDLVKIPHHSIGVTVAPIEPFSDSVKVSWLQPPEYNWRCGSNELRINADRRPIEDDELISIPIGSFSPSVFEPPGEDMATVYWLG